MKNKRRGKRQREVRRQNQHKQPPRTPIMVCLILPLAEGLKDIAAAEHKSVSRVISEALEDHFGPKPARPRIKES